MKAFYQFLLMVCILCYVMSTNTLSTHAQTHPPQAPSIDYTPTNIILEKLSVTRARRVLLSYDYIREEALPILTQYIRYLSVQDITHLSQTQKLAYWLNTHNIVMIKAIATDVKGRALKYKRTNDTQADIKFWHKKRVQIGSENLSLIDLEDKALNSMPPQKRALIIYGLYQGIRSAPALHTKAYESASILEILANAAQEYLETRHTVRIKNQQIKSSGLYFWYLDRVFEGQTTVLRQHMQNHAPAKKQKALASLPPQTTLIAKSLNYRIDELPPNKPDLDIKDKRTPTVYGS